MWSECAPTLLPRRLWPTGWGFFGERGTGAARLSSCSGVGLDGRKCCCRLLWRILLATSRMLCSVAVSGVVLPTVPDLRRRNQAWKEVALHPPLSSGPASAGPAAVPGGNGTGGVPNSALRPSWCGTGGPPGLRRPASSKAQPVPCGQTAWSKALSGLDGPPLPGLVCSAAPLAQSSPKHRHSPTLSLIHRPPNVRPSYARSLVPTPSETDPPPLMGCGMPAPLRRKLNQLSRPCGAG